VTVGVIAAISGPALAQPLSALAAAVAAAAGAIAGATLWWAQRSPVVVLISSLTASVIVADSGGYAAVSATAPLVALFYVGLSGRRVPIWACGVISAVVWPGLGWVFDREPVWTLDAAAADVALVTLPLIAGLALRLRRDYVGELLRRIELAELRQDDLAARGAEQERLRIARDLHDIVSHTISTINVQAGVAEHLLARDPAVARDALAAIKTSSREAMRDLREVLGMLRDPFDESVADASSTTSHHPLPGLDALPSLIAERRGDGLPVELRLRVDPEHVSGSVQLVGFRIVQEALTNVIRHAGCVPTEVEISQEDEQLLICVHNSGATMPIRSPRSEPNGVGLAGMRERVAALSGTLTVEHLRDDGFRLVAMLPFAGPR